jgi:hypothetical protein
VRCHRFATNAVRLKVHALAYNFADFLRALALPDQAKQWSLISCEKGWPRSAPGSSSWKRP